METLGDDLVLLAIRPNGVIAASAKLQFGLSGSELVRLAALRRVGIDRGRIVVLDEAPTGDVLLDEALASMDGGAQAPTARQWVARNRGELVRRYLERLAAAGTVQLERRKALGLIPVNGWKVLDPGRLAAAKARLDGVAYGTGSLGASEIALAGLATAIGLPPIIYPGLGGVAARRRITQAVRGGHSVAEMTQAVGTPVVGAPDLATRAATDAAVGAAADAAVQASIGAATQAAIAGATDAAYPAHHATDGGGHVGGHH
ncbi:MAG TPA: GPP34 family phosphoprotein [Streptosporangiaceae bacterium]